MNLSTRSMGLALLLLLLFLGATVAVQWWVAHETKHLQLAAIEDARTHLIQAIDLSGRPFCVSTGQTPCPQLPIKVRFW